MSRRPSRWSLLYLRVCGLLVPRYRRREWVEEWVGELEALSDARTRGREEAYPGTPGFLAGALPHALWTRREEWTMDGLVQDVRYGLRMIRRGPGFSLVAILTLALGIGANGAIFSLVNGVLLRPPPGVADPWRMVQIARSYDEAPRWDNWSWPAFKLIQSESDAMAGVEGFSGGSFLLGRGQDTELVPGEYVSGGYFRLLGVNPAVGRLLDPGDEVSPGGHPVVVLSQGLWHRRYGGDPEVVGQVLHLGGEPYEIVGVAPEGFVGIDAMGTPPELWVSAMQRQGSRGVSVLDRWGSSWFYVFGKLAPGVSLPEAKASMDRVTAGLRSAWEENGDIRALLAPGLGLTPEERAEGRRIFLLLGGIGLMVLLLTCANVGNLFLARAATRETEMGIRQALGAGKRRLVRQLVTESVAMALAAAVITVPVLSGAGATLKALFPFSLAVPLAPDLRVYLFLGGVALVAGVLFGTAPALALARRDVAHTLREGASTGGRSRTRLRDTLVVGQLAISLGLVSGAALLGRSVLNASRADPGFDPDGVLVGFINLAASGRYEGQSLVDYQRRLVSALERIPGVENAALAGQAPILGGHARSTVAAADRPEDPRARFEAEYTVVTPGYFDVLDIPLLQGRTLRPPEEEPEPVVVANETLARMFWPGQEAVGQELVRGEDRLRVVGVVGDVQMRSLRSPANPGVYYPFHQEEEPYVSIHLETRGAAPSVISAMKAAVASVDPEVPVTGITDLRSGLSRSLSETRTFGIVVAVFAGLALVLSVVGLYGLMAYGVTQRIREMGIRMALGAPARELVRLVLARGLVLSGFGLVLGLGVALAVGQALKGALFGVGAANPTALAGSAVLLLGSGLLAAWIPARRASRVDAAVSLRE